MHHTTLPEPTRRARHALTAKTWQRLDREVGGLLSLAQEHAFARAHNAVRSEHLLLAVANVGDVTDVLLGLGVTRSDVRDAVARRAPRGDRLECEAWLPLAVDARESVWCALEEAAGFGHGALSAVHVLLGMLRAGGLAAEVLAEFGVSIDAARFEVLENAAARDERGLGAA